ncbi:MAG TPA: hypothetical protein VK718_07180 [Ferruginibacter sp.]|jgi:hypothetical protein|nr:hypothetical protein [Ferruginibacter sp.]
MESTKKSTTAYWVLFILSMIATVAVCKFFGGYFTLVLPFNFTFFAKALDLM